MKSLANDIKSYTFARSNNNAHTMKKYKVREVIRLLEADGWVKLKDGKD